MALYLIKRGPRPDYHRAPYHPVIVCADMTMADWEIGCTCQRATVWTHDPRDLSTGWLLQRWRGLVIDYGGGVQHGCSPVEGVHGGYYHDRYAEPWTLLPGAVWWTDKRMPAFLEAAGVVYPSDNFTQQDILDWLADQRAERDYRKQLRQVAGGTVIVGFSVSGFGRAIPEWWSKSEADEG
ncbi:MAG: hypothetical protein WC718_18170 [Phycisphaerales bacterium]